MRSGFGPVSKAPILFSPRCGDPFLALAGNDGPARDVESVYVRHALLVRVRSLFKAVEAEVAF